MLINGITNAGLESILVIDEDEKKRCHFERNEKSLCVIAAVTLSFAKNTLRTAEDLKIKNDITKPVQKTSSLRRGRKMEAFNATAFFAYL
jgi:hypothetical protein